MHTPAILHRTPTGWHSLSFDADPPTDWVDYSRTGFDELVAQTAAPRQYAPRAPYPPEEEPLG